MPRPIEYDRDEVLNLAMRLFWTKGYEQTSVRDVLNTTGFNRHSLYEEFGGKDGLFKAVLNHYRQHIANGVIKPLTQKDSDLETIRTIFSNRAKFDQKGIGCLLSNTANIKQSINKELYSITKTYNRKVEKAFEFCISNAQRKGQIAKNKDARLLSRYITTVLHGLSPMSKLGITKKETLAIGELTINSLLSD